ncbi:MAG: hypothetical protein JWQ25_2473 [Daejeonella sp.]|nr:hypothetical protein [Daejeonella sp.]
MGVSFASFSIPDNGIGQKQKFIFNGWVEFFDLIDQFKGLLVKTNLVAHAVARVPRVKIAVLLKKVEAWPEMSRALCKTLINTLLIHFCST